MRVALAISAMLVGSPGFGWEFTPDPVCTVRHEMEGGSLVMTFDPRRGQAYSIAVTRAGTPWPAAPGSGLAFIGPRGMTISTTRHVLSDGGATLSVSDSGFGNVLNGLEFNETAVALSGTAEIRFPLAGAAPEIRAFRACAEGGVA